jgi:NAD(P)-dependent dehydrogenase (short-subunit alcohol dehydrogenase family)
VLITGCSTGIGAACARHLAGLGWTVFAGVRHERDSARLADEGPGRVTPVLIDVTDPASIESAVAVITESRDRLEGVVNNAGIGLGGPVEYLPLEDWRRQFDVNVIGPVAVTRATFDLVRRGSGRFVFIGSANGRVSGPFFGPYAGSKHALEAVCEAIRHETHGSRIRVSLIEPGAVKTAIWEKTDEVIGRVARDLPPEGVRRYGPFIDAVQALVADGSAHGLPPERVAAVVARALTARRPRARYLVGADAKVIGLVARVAPDRLRDVIIRRQLGL